MRGLSFDNNHRFSCLGSSKFEKNQKSRKESTLEVPFLANPATPPQSQSFQFRHIKRRTTNSRPVHSKYSAFLKEGLLRFIVI